MAPLVSHLLMWLMNLKAVEVLLLHMIFYLVENTCGFMFIFFLFHVVNLSVKTSIMIPRKQSFKYFIWRTSFEVPYHSLFHVSPTLLTVSLLNRFCCFSKMLFLLSLQLISKCEVWKTSGRVFMLGNEKCWTTDGQRCTKYSQALKNPLPN